MRMNRSWILIAIAGLMGMGLLAGCGSTAQKPPEQFASATGESEKGASERERAATESEKAAADSEKASEESAKMAPLPAAEPPPIFSGENGLKDIVSSPAADSSEQKIIESIEPQWPDKIEPKSPAKAPAPAKTRAKILDKKLPDKASKRASTKPQSANPYSDKPQAANPQVEDSLNPMRSPATTDFDEANPVRPGSPALTEAQPGNSYWDKEVAPDSTSFPAAPSTTPQPGSPPSSEMAAGSAPLMEESDAAAAPMERDMATVENDSNATAESKPKKYFYKNEKEAETTERDVSKDTSSAKEEYTVVKVFYATDRASLDGPRANRPVYRRLLWMTIGAAVVTLFFSILAFRHFNVWLMRALAYSGMFITVVFAALTIYARFQNPVHADLAKTSYSKMISYGGERGPLELGSCDVSIPKRHEVGELESPSILDFEFREDPNRHIVLIGVQREPADQFYANVRACVGKSSNKSAFVFVHGFNTSFDDAARRTAQIAYDLKFDGAPIFYSWPSQAHIWEYPVDETNVAWTEPHLRQFLTDVASQSGAEHVHLIAHSMGNRALTSAIRDLSFLPDSLRPKFDEVVLTAPDIDAELFKNEIAPAVVKMARRVTLYASSNDEALILSKKVHGYARAGDTGSELIVLPGLDTVDVSAVDTSLLGHSYYGENVSVLADIIEVFRASKPADQRHWLHAHLLGKLKYWVFQLETAHL
jgi:esterase/lipase superfamily enzyme